jgi:hypothetical protein
MTRAIHCSMDLGLSNLVRVFLDIYSKANDNFLKSSGLLAITAHYLYDKFTTSKGNVC